MKSLKLLIPLIAAFSLQSTAIAQSSDFSSQFKKHVNEIVGKWRARMVFKKKEKC